MNLQSIKKLLGDNYNVAQRANGQISVGIANNRLRDTVDAAKVRELREAHAKLQAQSPGMPSFDECFKAGNPPQGDNDKDKNDKPIWRQYLHLLFDPGTTNAAVAIDPGVEFMRMLLAAGQSPEKAVEMVMALTKGTKPAAAPTTSEIVDGDEEVPV